MKNLFKVVAVAVLSLGFGVAAQAQETVTSVTNTTITASADVLAALDFAKVADINFGSISAVTPGDVYLDPNGVTSLNIGTTAVVGEFLLTAAVNKSVRFGWPATVDLMSGSNKMVYTLKVVGGGEDVDQADAEHLVLNGGAVDVTTSATGKYLLYVGGTIPKLAGQAVGVYSGTAMFTVEYN